LVVSVTMACRNPSRCDTAANTIRSDAIVVRNGFEDRGLSNPGSAVVTMIVDTSSLRSVKTFCDEFRARNDDGDGNPSTPLDMLFLNAGIGFIGPSASGSSLLQLSEDGIELMFATNVVGHHLMYKLLEPSIQLQLRRTTPARIVLTSSQMSYKTIYPYKVATDLQTLNGVDPANDMSLYSQSKLAQVLWANELTARLDAAARDSNSNDNNSDAFDPNSIVYVNAGHPGAVATNIWSKLDWDAFPLGRFLESITKSVHVFLMWTPEEAVLTLLYLGTALEELQTKNIRGQYFHPQAKWVKDHKDANDDDPETKLLQENLWKFLDELVANFVP